MAARRILVVDDTQEILDLFRVILEAEGYEVFLSTHAFENVIEIEHLHPDLLILDFLFGKHNEGWQLLQMLKMHAPTASIPVIICTAALKEVREQEDYLQKKEIQIVFKPFDIDELVSAVKHGLESSPPLL